MVYFTYLLKCITPGINKTYAGYSSNVEERLLKHNSNKGAKSTRGFKWKLIYKKKFISKSKAMSYEYKLKKDRKTRNEIINNKK